MPWNEVMNIKGPQGDPGDPGADGAPGVRGSLWFEGHGAPGVILGAPPNDHYLDLDTGSVYTFS
jgi:hypothetical protein